MLNFRLARSFASIRIYSTVLNLSNKDWSLDASLTPPTLVPEEDPVKMKYQSSLLISMVWTADRFKKGRKAEYYPLKNQALLQLACWTT